MSLMRPKSWLNIDAQSSAVTKPGMAYGRIRIDLKRPLPLSRSSLKSRASSMPRMNVEPTEITAKATFQVKILRKPARMVSLVTRVEKFSQPTFSFQPCGNASPSPSSGTHEASRARRSCRSPGR